MSNKKDKDKAPAADDMTPIFALFNAGRYVEVESRARALVARYPGYGLGWKVLGTVQKAQGKDALAALQQAARLFPDDAETHNNLGVTLLDLGRLADAAASLRRALAIKPDYGDAHYNLGNTLYALGEGEDAVASYRRALQLKVNYVEAHCNLGIALHKLGQFEGAVASFLKALEIQPNLGAAHHVNLGNALKGLGRFDEAAASYRRAIAIKPDYAEAHNNLGNALQDMGKLDEAVASYRLSLQFNADHAEVHCNLGIVLQEMGQVDAAVHSYRLALQHKPELAMAQLSLGQALLLSGDYAEGWQKYEYRWDGATPRQVRVTTSLPQWRGETPQSGDGIVVFVEQGMGDKLQFARYLPLVAQRFSGRLCVVAGSPLQSLFQRSFADWEVLAAVPSDHSAWQWQCPLLSLPLALQTTVETIPQRVPYLIPDPDRTAYWREKIAALGLANSARKIGIVWKTGRQMKNADLRSLALRQLAPLLDAPDCRCFSLQKEADDDKGPLLASGKLIDWSGELENFDDTAALAVNLDLVIAVDTSVAHLAGALGLPIWLLNRHASEWRWMRGRDDNLWYPTMRIFTQTRAGDWDEVVARVVDTLAALPAAEWQRDKANDAAPTPEDMKLLVALFKAGRHAQAESTACRLLARHPDFGFAWKALGAARKMQGKDAVSALQQAARLLPADAESHNNLGVALQDMALHAEAAASLRAALALKPDYAQAHYNLGNALQALGRSADAVAHYRRALQLEADFPEARGNLGLTLLRLGEFSEGWQKYEARWEAATPPQPRPVTDLPQWRGQAPQDGDGILIFVEQGLGDKLQFARYLPLLAERFSGRKSIVGDPALSRLFCRSFADWEVLSASPTEQSAWQWQCPLLSLPLAFGTTLETIPKHVPYLIPDPLRATSWRDKIAALGLPDSARKIGIVWKTGRRMADADTRSLALRQL
ncbi:MAG: tetratricopeptide repeat protein [Burkholderiaceae bacterium]|nr:tetratricopeptide repeat protein [Burkholderiaceae bacterium]